MTTAVELPTTLKRWLMMGLSFRFDNIQTVEVPITNFTFHAALDANDKPIADWVGVYHGVVQLKDNDAYFWKAVLFEITKRTEPVELIADPSPETIKAAEYAIRFSELSDLSGPAARLTAIEPIFNCIEMPRYNTNHLRTNGELVPTWVLTTYEESLSGERRAVMTKGNHVAEVILSSANVIEAIAIDGKCVKSLNPKQQTFKVPADLDATTTISEIEYSFLAQRFSKAIVGVENPIIAAGKVDLSAVAAPTYQVAAEQSGTEVVIPGDAYLDADSPEQTAQVHAISTSSVITDY